MYSQKPYSGHNLNAKDSRCYDYTSKIFANLLFLLQLFEIGQGEETNPWSTTCSLVVNEVV